MLDDAQASKVVDLYPHYPGNGELVKAGTRIVWNGQLKRAATDLWATEQNAPDCAPELWEDINYHKGYRIIPDTLTVGTAFEKNECGWWKDKIFRSIYDGKNVWTPDEYPAGWEVIK